MKKKKNDSKKIKTFILDIFFGGREYKTTSEKRKTPFPFTTVALAVVSTALVLSLIFSLIEISELSAEIASMKRQTVSLEIKKASLENELDHRYSFAEIIETAKALGYSADGGRVVYIETDGGEDNPEETENLSRDEEKESS